jgi:hypothetical protein
MIGSLPNRGNAIVATRTRSHHLAMIDIHYGNPSTWVMAIFANIGRANMLCVFTCSGCTVMAADAVAPYPSVVKAHIIPIQRGVAIVTGIKARNMGSVLARCRNTIVAADTGAIDRAVGYGNLHRNY